MLDTQVYSNTGGQNSDSSPMPGGFDMNQFGAATEGKLTEKKSLAEIFTVGHGSPYVAQVSMANAAKLYKVLLDALSYRGTAFLQCYTSCQPEHGVADNVSTRQAQRVRDSRGMPEFVFDSSVAEDYLQSLNLKGNPSVYDDWWTARYKNDKQPYKYTVAHWAATEARFRRHLKVIKDDADIARMIPLDDMLLRLTQNDVVHRRFLDKEHRAYIPPFGVYIQAERDNGKRVFMSLSRQMVIFCVERRKSWRLLQSRAGIVNNDYRAQQAILKRVDDGDLSVVEFRNQARQLFEQELEHLSEKKLAKKVKV